MGEVTAAAEVIRQRKLAAGAVEAAVEGTYEAAERVIRLTAVGLDIDLTEVRDHVQQLAPLWSVLHVAGGVSAGDIAAGAWSDGLMVGLLVAERRAREEGS